MWGEVQAGRREAAGDSGVHSVQGRARLQIRGRERGGAHGEHPCHVRDAGGVEAQRLVERCRALPRVTRRAYGVGRSAGWEAGGGRRRATTGHTACRGGLDCRFGAGNGEERTLNMAYMVVTLDVSKKLSGWLNANASCRVGKRAYAAGPGAGLEMGGGGRQRGTQRARREGLDCNLGAGHEEERTLNMPTMFVTLEVLKELSGWLNADANCRESRKGGIRCGARYTGREAGGGG